MASNSPYETIEDIMESADVMKQVVSVWKKPVSELSIKEKAAMHAATALLRTDPSIIADVAEDAAEGSVGYELSHCYKSSNNVWDPSCEIHGLEPTTVVFRTTTNGLMRDYGLGRSTEATIKVMRVHPIKSLADLTDNDRALLFNAGVRNVRLWHETDDGKYRMGKTFTVEEPVKPQAVQEPSSSMTTTLLIVAFLLILIIALIAYIVKNKLRD